MYKLEDKYYDNEKGYIYIPIRWREEFDISNGSMVGIDCEDEVVIIDKDTTREFIQKISKRGALTIPLELRQKLKHKRYSIYIVHAEEKVILKVQ